MKKIIAAGALALVALTATACDSGDDYTEVCVDQVTGLRVADVQCGTSVHSNLIWMYYPISTVAPAIGRPYRSYPGYTQTLPQGRTLSKTRVPTTGGKVTPPKSVQKPSQPKYRQPGQPPRYQPPRTVPRPAPPVTRR